MSVNNHLLLQNGENRRQPATNQSVENVHGDRRTSIARQRSYDNMATSAEANVLVIYTGGTVFLIESELKISVHILRDFLSSSSFFYQYRYNWNDPKCQ